MKYRLEDLYLCNINTIKDVTYKQKAGTYYDWCKDIYQHVGPYPFQGCCVKTKDNKIIHILTKKQLEKISIAPSQLGDKLYYFGEPTPLKDYLKNKNKFGRMSEEAIITLEEHINRNNQCYKQNPIINDVLYSKNIKITDLKR